MKELFHQLMRAESEDEVKDILKKAGYWDDDTCWRDYGDDPGNWSIIGNQKASAVGALDELLVNSIDAMLLSECKRRGIDPESDAAPTSMKEAVDAFFGIPDGVLTDFSESKRRELSENIILFTTGQKDPICLNILDCGEGQNPDDIPKTFLSLRERNKVNIRFLQGLYNQGGSGVIRHCGDYKFKLILTRKDPKTINKKKNSDLWGFTITRIEFHENARMAVVKYLAPQGKILTFSADSVSILQDKPHKYGTFIKLYNYKLEKALKTHIAWDLNYRLSRHLPSIPYPIKLLETRPFWPKSHSNHAYCLGLSVRLDEDKRNNVEDGFPSTGSISIGNIDAPYKMYVMRKDVEVKRFSDKLGVIFEQNGQMQGYIERSWFNSLKMDYIRDSLAIIVSINDIDLQTKTEFTMSNREKLAESPVLTKIKKDLADIIRNHSGLRELQNRRAQEIINDKISEEVFSLPTLQKLVDMSPALAQILIKGGRISSPFKMETTGIGTEFKGKTFPTYFRLLKEFPENNPKRCPINQDRFHIQFETDVANDYFDRSAYPGSFELSIDSKEYLKRNISLFNGIATLAIEVPDTAQMGDHEKFTFKVTDEHRYDDPLTSHFHVVMDKEKSVSESPVKPNTKPHPPGKEHGDRNEPEKYSLPVPTPIYKEKWKEVGFDENTALDVRQIGDRVDYLINMDNKILLTELKANKKFDEKLLQQIYVDGMMIFSLLLVKDISKKENQNGITMDSIKHITKMLAPGLIPVVLGFSKELMDLYNT